MPSDSVTRHQPTGGGVEPLMAKQETHLATAVRLSGAMLEASRQHEWTQFAALEAQRTQVLEALFSTVTETQANASLSPGIRKILSIDEEIIAICEAVKKDCADELATISKSRQVHDSYTRQQYSP